MKFDNSKMYPGLPEYFDNQGRGLYAYLTGAASWYMLTMITEMFGVKGDCGDLKIAPALMPEQYNQDGKAVLKMTFAGRNFEIIFYNKEKKEEQVKKCNCCKKSNKRNSFYCFIQLIEHKLVFIIAFMINQQLLINKRLLKQVLI